MVIAATLSLHQVDRLPALVVTAPGYLVQSWLFVRHRALGGLGYQVTVIGVSALFWSIVVLSVSRVGRYVLYRFSRRRAV